MKIVENSSEENDEIKKKVPRRRAATHLNVSGGVETNTTRTKFQLNENFFNNIFNVNGAFFNNAR